MDCFNVSGQEMESNIDSDLFIAFCKLLVCVLKLEVKWFWVNLTV